MYKHILENGVFAYKPGFDRGGQHCGVSVQWKRKEAQQQALKAGLRAEAVFIRRPTTYRQEQAPENVAGLGRKKDVPAGFER